ncbi:imelysin family protein [Pseudomonas sp. N040]|uniref:imelysin family protein n=1 Tax=Pseudomonas sp. N040 TaxID=2785325 RepID=UPI0018A29A35|nr:imelysin family protein [Pseudomonas sp. N040]MBF7728471.1 imelysin [Pseudomonas sp. N040]MBW7012111.1 imelysin [Pseudomonas sp. N040]
MIRITRLALGGLALLLAGCTPPDPQQQVSAALAQQVLLPAYQVWAQSSRQLAESAASFCTGQQDLARARQALLATQDAWATLQPLALGPLGEGNRAWQVQFWPDKKNLVARQVETLLKGDSPLTQGALDQASVVVQGLSAYEYVLFDPAIDLAVPATRARYCPLLTAIGQHQRQLADSVLAQWQANEGMAAQLQAFPNARYALPAEAVADLLRTQVTALDGLKKKLATPLGRQNNAQPQPYQAENWRSDSSLRNLSASLRAADSLWQGHANDGLRRLLNTEQQALARRIDAAYSTTRQQLDGMSASMHELLATAAGRQQLGRLYEQLDQLHRLHERELAKALGVQLGFNAHDGD